jgi:hypothetical protein
VEKAAAEAEAAKSRVEKIERGEDVEGGLFQKPFDAEALLKEWERLNAPRVHVLSGKPVRMIVVVMGSSSPSANHTPFVA